MVTIPRMWFSLRLGNHRRNIRGSSSLSLGDYMLPITLLNAAQGQVLSVECKSGRTYTGRMKACDFFMSVTLEDVTCSSRDEKETREFHELYLRGSSIKYVKIPDQLLTDIVEERQAKREEMYGSQYEHRIEHRGNNQRGAIRRDNRR